MKQKTRKSVAKRFKMTKKGKILRGRQMGSHLKRKKRKSQKRRQKRRGFVSGADKTRIAKMMGGK